MKHKLAVGYLALLFAGTAMAFNPKDIVTASLARPIWALGLKDAAWLIPPKTSNAPSFAIMSFSAEKKGVPEEGQEQKEDDIGRTTRALPLYIAERINLETQCSAVNYNPVLKGKGPVLSAKRTSGDSLAKVFQGKHAFIITGHFERDYLGLRNKLTIYLYDMQSGKEQVLVQRTSLIGSQSDLATSAADELFDELEQNGTCSFHTPPAEFQRPPKRFFREYMDGLGQLLMQTLVQNDYVSKDALWGENRMLSWYLSLCEAMPESVAARLMYISGVLASLDYGTEAYKPHIAQLTEYLKSLNDISNPINRISPLFFLRIRNRDLFDAKKKALEKVDNDAYRVWLKQLTYEQKSSNKRQEATGDPLCGSPAPQP